MAKYNFSGGKSKGKTLSDVAKMHGMTSEELRPQYNKGTDHELEHTNNVIIAKRIALDHLVEFPDYYDRLDKIEKMKKGAVVERPTTFNDIVLYHEKKGNWLFAKGNFYAWLYDQDGAGKKVETGEYDFIMFPPMGKGSPFSENYVPPLLMVWQKSYQKNYKGSEHLLGIVKGFYDEDKNQLIIGMMTSNPKFRRQGINAHIIKQLRTEFGISQDNVIFDAPTKEGKLFESSKKYHLGGDMSKHLAPNGKPSNLTHEQWHLVRTPEFKDWFGDWENDPKNSSKVVDENGEPLVVYRGSKSKNANYIPHKHELSNGIYFSTKKDVAELYTTSVWQNWVGRVFDCFLNIRNIDYYDTLKFKSNIYQADFEFYNKLVTQSKKNNFDGIGWDNFIDIPDLQTIFPKDPNDYKATTFIVFDTTQIKLADGTNTTFDSNNPDIRFDKGGLISPNGNESNLTPEQYKLVRSQAFKDWFGDWENDPKNASKVVDENGEPLVMYHGTAFGEFNEFDLNRIGRNYDQSFGFYFTNIKSKNTGYSAQEYANRKFISKKPYVFEVFLNIKNPILQEVFSERPAQAIDWERNELKAELRKGLKDGVIAESRWQKIKEVIAVTLNSEQIKLADGTNTTFDSNNPDIRFDKGGRTIAQTPAPKSDRVVGSKTNAKGSASDSELGKSIKFNDALEKAIQNKVDAYNEKHTRDKVSLSTATAVVRRGMGAYSTSHRPTISGGAPNSRQAWGLARLNKFLLKKSGGKVKSAYIQDDDLL